MKCPRCNGNGRIELLEHCPLCRGRGEIESGDTGVIPMGDKVSAEQMLFRILSRVLEFPPDVSEQILDAQTKVWYAQKLKSFPPEVRDEIESLHRAAAAFRGEGG